MAGSRVDKVISKISRLPFLAHPVLLQPHRLKNYEGSSGPANVEQWFNEILLHCHNDQVDVTDFIREAQTYIGNNDQWFCLAVLFMRRV